MTQKHTPLPWVISPPYQAQAGVGSGEESWTLVHPNPLPNNPSYEVLIAHLRMWPHGQSADVQQANARLIAAAPDLLASLEADQNLDNHILNHVDCPVACIERSSLWGIAREKRVAAIAKATSPKAR